MTRGGRLLTEGHPMNYVALGFGVLISLVLVVCIALHISGLDK